MSCPHMKSLRPELEPLPARMKSLPVDERGYSARNCPFLNNSNSIRRVDETISAAMDNVAGFALTRNPGVTMLWTCKDYSVFNDGQNKPLLHMGAPTAVEWYANGKPATREEVLASIDGGFPALAEMALKQEGAMKYLTECREKFEKWIPA